MVVALLLMGLGGGVTYWALSAKLKREWAALIPARPTSVGADDVRLGALEARIRSGEVLALAELAQVYEAVGAFEAARQAWETVLAINPQRAEWWLRAAELQAAAGESRVAKQGLEQARKLGLSDGEGHWRLGQLAERLGDQVEAQADYARAVELDPQHLPAWLRRLTMYRNIGDEAAARRVFAQALAANPDAPELLMDRAQRFRDRGNWRQAVTDFERVMALRPDLAGARYATAQAYFQLGRRAEGEALLQEWLAGTPDDVVALMLLCVEALAEGDQAATNGWLVRLRQLPEFEPADEARLRSAYEQQFGEPPPASP